MLFHAFSYPASIRLSFAVFLTAPYLVQSQTCYYPNGNPSLEPDAPCNDGTGNCCPLNWQCLSNGLCYLPSEGYFQRTTCTDKSWGSSCPQICTYDKTAAGNEAILRCGSNQYCCDKNRISGDCCIDSSVGASFSLQDGHEVASITTVNSGAPASTPTSNPPQASTGGGSGSGSGPGSVSTQQSPSPQQPQSSATAAKPSSTSQQPAPKLSSTSGSQAAEVPPSNTANPPPAQQSNIEISSHGAAASTSTSTSPSSPSSHASSNSAGFSNDTPTSLTTSTFTPRITTSFTTSTVSGASASGHTGSTTSGSVVVTFVTGAGNAPQATSSSSSGSHSDHTKVIAGAVAGSVGGVIVIGLMLALFLRHFRCVKI